MTMKMKSPEHVLIMVNRVGGKTVDDSRCIQIKQAERGPRRRHIEGSKIAKGLQSVKKTLYPNFENVISELWKRYIRTWKHIITLKTFQRNEQESGPFRVN